LNYELPNHVRRVGLIVGQQETTTVGRPAKKTPRFTSDEWQEKGWAKDVYFIPPFIGLCFDLLSG